ncbi:MAG: hypothetical protein AAF939_18545 [Planctomycetota bacterium]
MFAGIAHFIFSVYIAVYLAFSPFELSSELSSDSAYIRFVPIVAYCLGLVGGLSGMGMYWFLTLGRAAGDVDNSRPVAKRSMDPLGIDDSIRADNLGERDQSGKFHRETNLNSNPETPSAYSDSVRPR